MRQWFVFPSLWFGHDHFSHKYCSIVQKILTLTHCKKDKTPYEMNQSKINNIAFEAVEPEELVADLLASSTHQVQNLIACTPQLHQMHCHHSLAAANALVFWPAALAVSGFYEALARVAKPGRAPLFFALCLEAGLRLVSTASRSQ